MAEVSRWGLQILSREYHQLLKTLLAKSIVAQLYEVL